VEVAARLAASDAPDLAEQFLAFMLMDAFQDAIPTTNWMYPAAMPEAGLPEGFESLRPETTLYLSPEEAAAQRGPAVEAWRAALSQ
jgi:thiamine transport system substrate-binding protein